MRQRAFGRTIWVIFADMSETVSKIWSCQPGFQEKFVRSNVDVCFGGGVLNPQPLDSLVHTPYGFKRMGDIRVGDIVSTVDGGIQQVLAVIDRGINKCISFRLADGRTVRCGMTHTFPVMVDMTVGEMSAAAIIRFLSHFRNERIYIPVSKSVEKSGENEYVEVCSWKKTTPCNMRCIHVSGDDHLYITDNYIQTHNCGKTFASVLSTAECSLDPEFRAVFIRKTFTEITSGGGMYDEFRTIYGDWASYKQSQPPRVTFPSGAYVEFRQVNNEDLKKIQEEWKGSQYTMIYIDEATSVAFSTFKYLMSRNRSKSRFHPTIKATMNPERECWIRPFIDWYVGPDGKIIPERDGKVRYFFIYGNDPTDVFWGNTKEEVYRQGKSEIDRKLRALGGDFTYENLIKSFVFYLGKMSENKASIGNNMDYAGSVASVGGHQAEQFIEGNWNASSRDESTYVVKPSTINALPNRERATNGMKYITVDLADTGSNSTVICVFDGFHLLDMEILNRSTPRGNAERVKAVARRHDIADSHIIYDAQRAAYMIDYIPEAVPYYSFSQSRGIYTRREYKRRKDENYARLIEAVNNGYFSIEPSVADKIFEQTKTGAKTVLQKMCEEGSVILWADDSVSGKKRLATKKEMNSKLGKGDSMDIWDACHMLMSAYEQYEFGAELTAGREAVAEEAQMCGNDYCNIYDDSTWA